MFTKEPKRLWFYSKHKKVHNFYSINLNVVAYPTLLFTLRAEIFLVSGITDFQQDLSQHVDIGLIIY